MGQVWKLMLLLRMPSLLGWELPLGPSGTKHTWLLRQDSSSSSSRLLTSTTLIIKQGLCSEDSYYPEGAVNKNTYCYQCLILVGTNTICRTGFCDMHFPALELIIVSKVPEMKAAY